MKQLNHTQVLEKRFLPSLITLGPAGSQELACIFQITERGYTDNE